MPPEIKLEWDIAMLEQLTNSEYTFEVYRSDGNGPLRYYKDVSTTSFVDLAINTNVLYSYAVKIKFNNGWIGQLSEVKSILVQ